MVQDIQKIKDRIAALLNTAGNDASTPNEKAVAMSMASAWMRKYNLEREDCEDVTSRDDYATVSVDTLWARLTPWESQLANFVASFVVNSVFCVSGKEGSTRTNYGTVGQAQIKFSGKGPDAAIAAETYRGLREQLLRQCQKKFGTPVRGLGRSYAVGFTKGLFVAAKDASDMEKAKAENAKEISTALIRTNMLKKASEAWYLSSTNGRLRTTNTKLGGIHNGAFNAGVSDGKVANRGARNPVAGMLN